MVLGKWSSTQIWAVMIDSCMWENLVWLNSEGMGQKNNTWEWTNPSKSCPFARTKMYSVTNGLHIPVQSWRFCSVERSSVTFCWSTMQYQAVSLSLTCQHSPLYCLAWSIIVFTGSHKKKKDLCKHMRGLMYHLGVQLSFQSCAWFIVR